jgi:hypothetical protein
VANLASIYALLSIQRGGGPTAWETCEARLSQCEPSREVIAVTQSGSYLERKLRKILANERLFTYRARSSLDSGAFSLSVQVCQAEQPDLVLGAYDYDLVPARHPWPHADSDTMVRMRTVDTLHRRSHKPGLIVIEADVSDILSGAVGTIEQHRPMVLINLLALSPTARLIEWERCVALLAPFGYRWFDGFRLPRDTSDSRRQLVGDLSGGVAWAQTVPEDTILSDGAARGLAMLSELDWVPDVRLDAGKTASLRMDFDHVLPMAGLHPPETNGSGSWWCWSGPSSRVRLGLALPAGGTWFLRLDILDRGTATEHHDLRAYRGETELALTDCDPSFVRFGPIAVPPHEASGRLMIEIDTPPPCRASRDDPRLVGVCFSGCVLERAV